MFFNLALSPLSFANEENKLVISAEKTDKSFLIGEVHSRVLKKYNPIKLTLVNKNSEAVKLPQMLTYELESGKIFKVPTSDVIFQKTKVNTAKRTVLSGFAGLIIFTIPAVAASSALCLTINSELQDNIERNLYRQKYLTQENTYTTYIFIPKKYKKVKNIMFKNICSEKNCSDYKIPIQEESL